MTEKQAARLKLRELLSWFQMQKLQVELEPLKMTFQHAVMLEMLLEAGLLDRDQFEEKIAEKIIPHVENLKKGVQKKLAEQKLVVAEKKIIVPGN